MSDTKRNVTVVSLEIWNAKDLNADQKMILLEIDRMDRLDRCYASNQKFADLLNKSRNRACEILQGLIRSERIGVSYEEIHGKERRILTVLPLNQPIEISTANEKQSTARQDQSKSRQDQSTGRQDQSKSRQHNKENRIRRIDKENISIYTESGYLNLLKKETIESYKIGLGHKIKDWHKLFLFFENQCVLNGLPKRPDFVRARLENLIMTWSKNSKPEESPVRNGFQPQMSKLIPYE